MGNMRLFRAICWICAVLGMLHVIVPARGQSSEPNAQPPAGALSSEPQPLKPAELDGLVAPIALYPDTLLANDASVKALVAAPSVLQFMSDHLD